MYFIHNTLNTNCNYIEFFIIFHYRMYCSGLNPNIEMLYDPISYPVASGTPPIHTLSIWNHEEEWSTVDVSVMVSYKRKCLDK